MKCIIAFAAVLAIAYAQAPSKEAAAQTIAEVNEIQPDGAYKWGIETSNNIKIQAVGTPKDFGGEPPLKPVVVTGSYEYPAPNGEKVAISYTADEFGYHPSGDSLPTPPPLPEHVVRLLKFIEESFRRSA